MDDVHPCIWLELPTSDIGIIFKIRLHIWISHENLLFALQHLQSDIGTSQITRDADDVVELGTRTVHFLALFYLSYGRHGNDQTRSGGSRVPTYHVNIIMLRRGIDSRIQSLHSFY